MSDQQDVIIRLPASLFQRIDNRDDTGVFFAFYNMSTLFPVTGGSTNRTIPRVGSSVLAATVSEDKFSFDNLPDPVTVSLMLDKNEGVSSCDLV